MQHPVAADSEVIHVTAFEKGMVHIHVAIGEFNRVSRREVIGRPTLHSNSGTSDPIAYDLAGIGVPIQVASVRIYEARGKQRVWPLLRLYAFYAELQVVHLRNPRKVEAGIQ